MRRAHRLDARALSVALLASLPLVAGARPAFAQTAPQGREVALFTIDGADIEDLLATPAFLALAGRGGVALLSLTDPAQPDLELRAAIAAAGAPIAGLAGSDLGSMTGPGGAASPGGLRRAGSRVARAVGGSTATDELVLIAVFDPDGPTPGLGGLIMAEGSPAELLAAMNGSPRTRAGSLTSDSTRRDGVVTSRDLATTSIGYLGLAAVAPDPGGSTIRVIDGSPPTDLYDRYLQQRRLSVPIGTAAALVVTVEGLLALLALGARESSRSVRALGGWLAVSAPFLALSLLLVGHLPSLTYATVIPFVIAATALPTLALLPVVRRRGTLGAIGVAGVMLLLALVAEAALGWTAALTPLLGGSQLDGARFFGLPNAFIGLLLGGSIYLAQRTSRVAGTAIAAAAGLFAGLPWTGSNLGGAITLFAAAGIWWGLRGRIGRLRTAVAATGSVVVGSAIVVGANRYLTSAPTHIARFVEGADGLGAIWGKLVDRLQVGVDLIVRNPFALVPVIGVLATLALVLRPPASLVVTFDEAPVWRDALLAIALGSLVAYVANDSGPAALGQGFTTSLGALLYVSLLRRNGIMEEA